MSETSKKFDYLRFFRALDSTREAKKKNWKEVAAETGVSASTLTRLSQGRGLDAPGLAALCAWSGLDATDFSDVQKEEAEPLALLTNFIAKDKRLSAEGRAALEEVVRTTYRRLLVTNASKRK